jgi:hypothetical protein
VRITIKTADAVGPLDRTYELQTNDPRNPVIKFRLKATIKPLPDYVKRLGNNNLAHGEQASGFTIWPTARPALTLERGEKASIALRIRPATAESGTLKMASGNTGGVSYKMRSDNGRGQWLDIEIEPSSEAGNKIVPIVLQSTAGDLTIHLALNILSENLTITPKALDLGEVSLADLKLGLSRRSRVGNRHVSHQSRHFNARLPEA